MQSNCEDPDNPNSYQRVYPDAQVETSKAWKNLANEWRLAIDLDGGLTKNNASNARILTSLALTEPQLPDLMPSMAEALAVLASSTLISGSLQATFRHAWTFPAPALGAPGVLEPFHAAVRTQEFTSTHLAQWQGIVFYPVLGLVLIINTCCLLYFIFGRRGLVTDFTEPQNQFALALNSPASRQLSGACGGGPRERDLVVPWRVAYDNDTNHYFFEEASTSPWRGKYRQTVAGLPDSSASSLLAVEDGHESRNRRTYQRLSNSKSWL